MWERIIDRIRRSGPVEAIRNFGKRLVLPGFEGLDAHYVTAFFVKGLSNGALAIRASSISFQMVMAFLPSVILLFSLIPLVSTGFEDKLMVIIADVMPAESYAYFSESILSFVKEKRADITLLTFVLFLYYSSRAVFAILDAFSHSVNLMNQKGVIYRFLISMVLILVLSFLVITALGLVTASEYLANWLNDLDILADGIQRWGFLALNFFIVFLLFMIIISILYNVGNNDQRWKIFSAGATFSSLMMILVSKGFAFYVNNFADYKQIYGVLGVLIIFFLWIYFNSLILLIGFELNASISKARYHRDLPDPDEVLPEEIATEGIAPDADHLL